MARHFLVVVLALTIAGLPAGATAWRQAAPALTDQAIEMFLTKARVVKSRDTSKGITGSVRATLSDGTLTHDAHIQTIDEAKFRFEGRDSTEFNFRDNWRFNVAAYRIDRFLGLNLVPVSVERHYRNKPGAYTWWVDDVMMDEGERAKKNVSPPDSICWAEQMRLLRLFDQLIDNVDRNAGNMLITTNWRLWGIDHTRAFRYSKTPRKPEHITRVDRVLLQRLKALEFAPLKKEIGRYVTDDDIRAVLSRRDAMVEYYEKHGEAALFDRRDINAGCAGS